jgi:hypothetical protein
MFGIGPAWLFLFQQRLPMGMMREGVLLWMSTIATNIAVMVIASESSFGKFRVARWEFCRTHERLVARHRFDTTNTAGA